MNKYTLGQIYSFNPKKYLLGFIFWTVVASVKLSRIENLAKYRVML